MERIWKIKEWHLELSIRFHCWIPIPERGVCTKSLKNEEQSWTGDQSHIQRTIMTSTTTNTILNPRRTKSTHDSRHPCAMFTWSQYSTNTCKDYPAPINLHLDRLAKHEQRPNIFLDISIHSESSVAWFDINSLPCSQMFWIESIQWLTSQILVIRSSDWRPKF